MEFREDDETVGDDVRFEGICILRIVANGIINKSESMKNFIAKAEKHRKKENPTMLDKWVIDITTSSDDKKLFYL